MAGDVPGWTAAVAALIGILGGAVAAWVKLGDRVDRLESEMDACRDTLRRVTDLVWTTFGISLASRDETGRRPDPPDSMLGR